MLKHQTPSIKTVWKHQTCSIDTTSKHQTFSISTRNIKLVQWTWCRNLQLVHWRRCGKPNRLPNSLWFGLYTWQNDLLSINNSVCYSFVCSLSFCALIHVIILIIILFSHIHSDRFQRVAESDLEKTSWFCSVKTYTRNRSCQRCLFVLFDQGTFVPISANLRSITLSRIVFSEVVISWCNLHLAGKGVWLAIKENIDLSRFTSFPIRSCGRHVLLLLWA